MIHERIWSVAVFSQNLQMNYYEIEPISANIVTKDFFNPKKVQKGPQMGENTILGWMLHQFMKNVVFSLLLIKIWSFQEAFLSLLKTFEFWQWNLKIKYLLWLYHCYICNIILQMIRIQWNLESFIDSIHETFMRGSDSWQFSHKIFK